MIIDSHLHLNSMDGSYDKAYQKLITDMAENCIDKCIIIADNVSDSGCADISTALKFVSDKVFVIGSPNILAPKEGEYELLKKLLEDKKIIGLKFFPGNDAYYANDTRCNQYFRLAQKFNVPVVFHTGINTGDTDCARYNDPRLIANVARNNPKLKIVIAHYFWPKLDYCYEITRGFKNIFF